jgi:hypothetical protein
MFEIYCKYKIFLDAFVQNVRAIYRNDRRALKRFSRHAIERNELRNYKQF